MSCEHVRTANERCGVMACVWHDGLYIYFLVGYIIGDCGALCSLENIENICSVR